MGARTSGEPAGKVKGREVLWVIPRVVLLVLLQFSLDAVNRFRWLAFLGSEELENLIFSFSQKVILTLYLLLFLNVFRRLVMPFIAGLFRPMVYKLTTDPRSRSNNLSRLTSYFMIAANLMAFVALINIWAYSYVGVWLAGTLGTGVAISLTFILGLFTSSVLGNVLAYWVLNNVMEFEVGDRVQIGEAYGDVVNVGLFFTRIRTIKEETVSIPNLLVTGREIKNFSSVEAVLIHVPVTLGYDTEKEEAKALLIRCAEATEGMLIGEGEGALRPLHGARQVHRHIRDQRLHRQGGPDRQHKKPPHRHHPHGVREGGDQAPVADVRLRRGA